MKKTSIIISIILSLVISFIPLNNIVAENETITVTFDGNGGLFNDEESLEVVVGEDGKIDEESWPNDPTRIGYSFNGFYLNDELINNEYVFTEDTTLSAKWIFIEQNDNNENEIIDDTINFENVINLTSGEVATLTVDIDGGTLNNGYPDDWTELGDGKYSKEYSTGEYVDLENEWKTYEPTKDNLGFVYWIDENGWYSNKFYISEDITIKAKYNPLCDVIIDLVGGTPENGCPSGWSDNGEGKYKKGFPIENTANFGDEWIGYEPIKENYVFAEWVDEDGSYTGGSCYVTGETVIKAKYSPLLNVIVDLKGGTIDDVDIPKGWEPVAGETGKYTKKFAEDTYYNSIISEWQGVVPQYSAESGVGFVSFETDGDWYWLENDNSVITAKTGELKTVTVNINGGNVISVDPSWTKDLSNSDLYTKKYPKGYSTGKIFDELKSEFNINKFYDNKFFTNNYEYDYTSWEIVDDSFVYKAKYDEAIVIKIALSDNGTVLVNDEEINHTFELSIPASSYLTIQDSKLKIGSTELSDFNVCIEGYGNTGYKLDYFTLAGTKIDGYISQITPNSQITAVFIEGTQNYPVWIGGVQLSEENTTLLDGAVSFDPTTRVLTLDGANIVFSSPIGISFATNITLKVLSDSSITAIESGNSKCAIAGIYDESGVGSSDNPSNASNLNIVGNGKLTIDLAKTDGADFTHQINVEGIFANKIDISTDVEIISGIVSNASMNIASFIGIDSAETGGITVNNGKSVVIYVKSVSCGSSMPKCYLISGPLTIDDKANVDVAVGSYSNYDGSPTSVSNISLLSGTISFSSNPVGKVNLLQSTNLKTIEGANADAKTTDKTFTQANVSTPLLLSTKESVNVEGVSMTKNEFKSNETITRSGTPLAKKKSDSVNVTDYIDTWEYVYYKEENGNWIKLSTTPNDEGSYKLVVSANDDDYFGKLELPFTIVHAHNFSYKVNEENEAQLLATCSGLNCEHHDTPLTLTLTSPSSKELVYNETTKVITFADGEKDVWKTETGNDAPAIVYYLQDETTKTNNENSKASSEGGAPIYAGTYIAKTTVDTDKTAKLEFTVAAIEYDFEDGKNSEWKQGDSSGLVITSKAPYNEFERVEVDGEIIDYSNYVVEEGSTKVTLKKDYLDTLSLGEHTFAIVSKNGVAETKLTIAPKPSPKHRYEIPNTGVSAH